MSDGDEEEAESPPVPEERGWHPVPDNPNYQRFWDGQKWGEQRYWGGAGASAPSGSSGIPGPSGLPERERQPGPDPLALDPTPSMDAPVQYQQGLFGAPLNPRSPARRAGVVAVSVILFVVYLALHIFPTRLLVLFIGLGVVLFLVQLPMRLRFLRDPARRAAIREPVTFQSKVWLQFKYAPSRWPYFQVGRWDLAVRTDSFQVTNWVFGSRNRARSTFFHAAEARMWQKSVDGRDCIVVSGPTYNRSKVEFVFSADEGNAAAWSALAAAGVRGVPTPLTDRGGAPMTDLSGGGRSAPVAPDAPVARRGFQRVGSDLGTVRTPHADPANPTNPVNPANPPVPSQAGADRIDNANANANDSDNTARFGGRRRSQPIRAGEWTPVVIVGAVIFVLVAPLVLATIARVAFVPSRNSLSGATSVATTQCTHEPNSTGVTWTGSTARTTALVAQGHVIVVIEAVTPDRTELGGTRQDLPVPATATSTSGNVIPLGPVEFMLPAATTEQVSCQAFFAYPNGIG